MLPGQGPVLQSVLGTLLTWGLTAAGSALVFVFSSGQVGFGSWGGLILAPRGLILAPSGLILPPRAGRGKNPAPLPCRIKSNPPRSAPAGDLQLLSRSKIEPPPSPPRWVYYFWLPCDDLFSSSLLFLLEGGGRCAKRNKKPTKPMGVRLGGLRAGLPETKSSGGGMWGHGVQLAGSLSTLWGCFGASRGGFGVADGYGAAGTPCG